MNDLDLYAHSWEPIVVLRKRYVTLCENNYCAAMLLDIFCAYDATSQEYSQFAYDSEQYNPFMYSTVVDLTERLFGLFDASETNASINFLIEKEYIQVWYVSAADSDIPEIYRDLQILYLSDAVDKASDLYNVNFRAQYRESLETSTSTMSIQSITPEQSTVETTANLLKEEQKRVCRQNKRALKINLPATLTLEQWIATLTYFNWECAYCQKAPYAVLEHFIPLTHGEGTTQKNCVPACGRCNAIKKAWNPGIIHRPKMPEIEEGFERIKQYFETLAE